jgi:hypothetical protein
MKEKDGFVDCPQQQVILYVEKENGKYGPMQTGSYLTRNFLDDYEQKRKNLADKLGNQVMNKEISPVKYFMILEDLSLSELASRVGLRKSKVNKHLDYQSFLNINNDILTRYADVFNVSVSDMMNLLDNANHNVNPV